MNIRKVVVLSSSVVAAAVLWVGCGGPDNVGACNDYNHHLEQLDCGDISAVQQKCRSFESADCDWTGYFDCLTENTTCNSVDGTKVIESTAATACQSKVCS